MNITSKSQRRGLVVVGLVLVTAMSACVAGAAAGGDPPPKTASGVQTMDQSEAATKVDQLGREQFPTQYAGLETLDGGGLVVYRKPSADFDQAVQDLGFQAEVALRDAPYSAAELQTLADRVQADFGYWQGRGITISSVGALHDGTAVEVGTANTEQASGLLAERYGADPPVVVTEVGPVEPVPATG